jgi:SAM-dependent methyltransferase
MTDVTSSDALWSPSFLRNRDPILAVLTRVLPDRGTVLEIASGSGEHAIYFAAALPSLIWQPTDLDQVALRSIAAHRAAARLPNVRPPLQLDAAAASWPVVDADAVVAINLVHISPWRVAEGLLAGAGRVLGPGGVLFLYGPFKENGIHTAPSNAVFDESLRARNPEWGVRDVADLTELARVHGLSFAERVGMVANNLSLIFRRDP